MTGNVLRLERFAAADAHQLAVGWRLSFCGSGRNKGTHKDHDSKKNCVGFGTQVREYLDDRPTCVRETRSADVSVICRPVTVAVSMLTRDPDGEERCVACNTCAR